MKTNIDARGDSLSNDLMAISGLGRNTREDRRDGPEDTAQLELLQEKVSSLDKSVEHVADMLGAIKGQSHAENIVVEMGGEILKARLV
eukprot:13228247-Ditylum_brightwellii.AAC.1